MPPLPGTETILIVDDELSVLGLTHLMLRRYGYALIPANGGKEALHLFEVWPDLPVDLLMADVVMPDMNGIELAKKIRVLRPHLPVLFFSAYSGQEILRPVIARGVPYISKPFTSLQLTKKIREVLDKPKTVPSWRDAGASHNGKGVEEIGFCQCVSDVAQKILCPLDQELFAHEWPNRMDRARGVPKRKRASCGPGCRCRRSGQ